MDQTEFSARIEMNRPKLMKIAKSMVRSCDCEDAVQSAILAAWAHLPRLRDENAFDAWLAQIMVNRCRQIQRGYQKDKAAYEALALQRHEVLPDKAGLGDAMQELGDEERRLLCLHHEHGYSIKEISSVTGKSEDVVKMRLYRARKHLRTILISLLLLIALASVAVGMGMIDVNWFLLNRRAEPAVMDQQIEPQNVEAEYTGALLEVSGSDAVWNADALSVSFVYSIAGKDAQTTTVHSGNIGVDGVRFDHIWTDEGIVPVQEWAGGRSVRVFSVDGWQLGGMDLMGRMDYLPDGLGETFMAELDMGWIRPDQYESLLDERGMLAFEAELTLEDYESGEILEAQKVVIRVGAPTPQKWRDMYETYHR